MAAVSAGRVSKIQFFKLLKASRLTVLLSFLIHMKSQFVIGFQDIANHYVFAQVRHFVSPIFFRQWIWNNVIDVFVFSFSITYILFLNKQHILFKSQPWGFPFSWENQKNVSRFSNSVIPKEQMSESHHFLETMVSAVCYRKNRVTNLILFRF